MMAPNYILTETAHFEDESKKYLDTSDNTVVGLFYTLEEAWNRINWFLNAPLFAGTSEYVKKTENGAVIDFPGYLHAEWKIHDYDGERLRMKR